MLWYWARMSCFSHRMAHAAFGGWPADSVIFARTAPPVDVIGGIVEGTASRCIRARTWCPECRLCSIARNFPAARHSIGQRLPLRPPHNRAISGAACSAASETRKRTSPSSDNFISQTD